MRRMLTWTTTLGLGLLLLTGSAMAQEADEDAQDWGPPRLERLAERLDLSEEQTAKIQSIHENARDGVVGLRKEMMRLHNDLEGEMLEDEPNLTKVRQIAKQIGEIRTKMQISRLESQIAVRGVLTPEQRDKFLMMKERGRRGGPGMHECHGPGGMQGPGGPDRFHKKHGSRGHGCGEHGPHESGKLGQQGCPHGR